MTTSNLTNTQMNNICGAIVGYASLTAFNGTANILLMSANGSASTAGTQLANGSGYTTGGQAITFSAPSGEAISGPTSALSWTCSAGGGWSIAGFEIWDNSGSGVRWVWAPFTGQPISVANGNIFQIAASGISIAWQ